MSVRALACAFLLATALPTPAFAAQRDCRAIRALTNADGRNFADLRIGLDPPVSIYAGSTRADIANPESCDLEGSGDQRDLTCRWRFPVHELAVAFYDPLLERMRTCVREELAAVEIASQTPGWRIMRRNEALLMSEYSQTRVELSLIEHAGQADADATTTAIYLVELTVEFEQGD